MIQLTRRRAAGLAGTATARPAGGVRSLPAVAARAMRERFFHKTAEEQALVAATHMPFPGTGRIVRDGDGYTWLPADWDYDG